MNAPESPKPCSTLDVGLVSPMFEHMRWLGLGVVVVVSSLLTGCASRGVVYTRARYGPPPPPVVFVHQPGHHHRGVQHVGVARSPRHQHGQRTREQPSARRPAHAPPARASSPERRRASMKHSGRQPIPKRRRRRASRANR